MPRQHHTNRLAHVRGRDRLSVIEKMADILNAMLGVEAVFKSVFRD